MVKDQKTIGLSPDLIIHPGETLAEVLEDRGMSQKELATRTGMTEKHISTVVKCHKNISVAFARKLEYALGIDANFWINLQSNYDRELLEYEEVNNITQDEIEILKPLKDIILYFYENKKLDETSNKAEIVLKLRKLFAVSNLTAIPNITYNAAYRVQLSTNIRVNTYVLYAWQTICEMETSAIEVAEDLNIDLLKNYIPKIKELMFEDVNAVKEELISIFSECGIAFNIVKNFKGAPVQGFIKKTDRDKMILCLTLRQSRADKFWFTLFHEIGHIINGDVQQRFVDFKSIQSDIEAKANLFASETLMDSAEYKSFVTNNDFSMGAINDFARRQSVKDYIVIGRLQHDKVIGWDTYSDRIVQYKWAQ